VAFEWAQPVLPGVGTFLHAVSADLTARGLQPDVRVSEGAVALPDGNILGLHNLAQRCGQRPEPEWPSLIHAHFDAVLSAPGTTASADFSQVRPHLRLALQSDRYGNPGLQAIRRRLAEGLDALLVYDTPESAQTINPAEAQGWPVSMEELWRVGAANVRAESVVAPRQVRLDGGREVTVFEDQYYYTTSSALWLDQVMELDPAFGALVGVPRRHLMVTCALHDVSYLTLLGFFAEMLADQYQKGPGSISPHLYWWRQGSLTQLPLQTTGGNLTFVPPPEFNEAMSATPGRRGP
jgi:hypothetical protein